MIELEHVKPRALIENWMIAVISEAARYGHFPQVWPLRYGGAGITHQVGDTNKAIDYLIGRFPDRYCLKPVSK